MNVRAVLALCVALLPSVAPASPAATAEVSIDIGRVVRQIPTTLYGANIEWINDGQGLWSAQQGKLDPKAIELARKLGPTLLRFPGGVFSDAYHWRAAIGAQSSRPTLAHYPNGPTSPAHFGPVEAAEFAHAIGADLLLTVNAGSGTPQEAADWLRFMRRTGGPEERLWEIGNELYMKGDLSAATMTAAAYAQRFREFAAAMRAVDPNVRLCAIGGLNYGAYHFIADDRWTEVLLERAAPQMDTLCVHNAYAPIVISPGHSVDPRSVYLAMLAAPQQIEANLRDLSTLLARFEQSGTPISIAVTEWGPFFHVSPESPWVDHVKTMGSALFVASVLNVLARAPRVDTATFFKLNDIGFMGWIGQRNGVWTATAPYQAFELYRRHLGRTLVASHLTGPTFDAHALGVVAKLEKVPLVDAVATLDERTLTAIFVNRSDTQAIEASIELEGVKGFSGATVNGLYADSLDSNTGTELPQVPGIHWAQQADLGRFTRGGPNEIHTLSESLPANAAAAGSPVKLRYTLRPLSITCVTFTEVRRR